MPRRHAIRALLTLAVISIGTLTAGVAVTIGTQDQAVAIQLPGGHPKCGVLAAGARAAAADVELPPGWTWRLVCQPGEDWVGQADSTTRTITRRLGHPTWPGDLEWGLLHEAGHAWGHELTDTERAVWIEARGMPAGEWIPYGEHSGEATRWAAPTEDWAEAWAACSLGEPRWDWRPTGTTMPTAADCALMDSLLGR